MQRLRRKLGGVRRGGRPCASVGELSTQSFCISSGEQPKRRIESHDSPEELPQHHQEAVGCRIVVAKLLCRELWRCTNRCHTPVHRTTADTTLAAEEDTYGVRAILPRPEGRGLPRKLFSLFCAKVGANWLPPLQ